MTVFDQLKRRLDSELPDVKKNAALLYSLGRSASYAAEQWALPWIEFAVNRKSKPYKNIEREKVSQSYAKVFELLKQDAENMATGVYPYSVLNIESPYQHFKSLVNVFSDAVKISKRRSNKQAHDFDDKKDDDFEAAPDYTKRNYHFQTNGYFSLESADLYDHQVEILFGGSSHAMRRLILPLLKKQIPNEGEGLHFLELGCGTGILTRFVKLTFPKAKITASDMSSSYLKKAQQNLADLQGINFIQAHAEDLPFKNETFDLVYSCYLFHELPLEARKQTLNESQRVLKPAGLWGFVDSLQEQDDHDLDWALELFPKDFHEPFYKNYIQHPVEGMVQQHSMHVLERVTGFFTKAVLAKKDYAGTPTPPAVGSLQN
jgi:ubiquinone/menaquinone biosynthesis C-methylase UbiE